MLERNTIAIGNHVFAPRGDPGSAYLILDSVVGAPAHGGSLLGRPWGQLSAVVFKNTAMAGSVSAAGWDDWDHGCTDHGTPWWCGPLTFSEFNSSGPGGGAAKRVWWSQQLDAAGAARWTRNGVLRGWTPVDGLHTDATRALRALYAQRGRLERIR